MARLMVISSKRIYANRLHLSGLLRPVPLTPQQATVNPCLCQGLSNIHRQVCLGLLWGHSSFHMNPGVHKILFVQFSCSVMFDSLQPPSMPRFPVHHHLPEVTQTHVHWVGDAIQPTHSLSYPSPIFNISQYQGLFQ